jgi:ribokinase
MAAITSPSVAWDVVVIGGLNTDYLVRGPRLPGPGLSVNGDSFLAAPGGKGGNTAVAAARLGARTAIVGRVGDDERGRALVAGLTAEGIETMHVVVDARVPTGAALIQVDASGETQVLAALGANLRMTDQELHAAADTIRSARVVVMQLEVPAACVAAATKLAHDAGARIVLDPAPPASLSDDLLARVDVLRANAHEVEALTGVRGGSLKGARDGAMALLTRGVKTAIVEAPGGNLVVWPSGDAWLPQVPVTRVDQTGAGDAFCGALAAALAEGQPLTDAAAFGSAAAALATTALGAQTALPRREALEAWRSG